MGGAPTVAPGILIVDRYRLEALVPDRSANPVPGRSASRVGQLWRARDEVLARPVAVLVVDDDDPMAGRVLAGARAAASLTNPALAKVYDAGDATGVVFVVTEYFEGGSLEQQLQSGPLDPGAAIDLVADICEAVAALHRVGLCGMTPAPSRVLFTTSGMPRLAGVALADEPADGAERTDTIALAHLLYAALTARWPGDRSVSNLPPAPLVDGRLRTPRQVRGGVPREIDLAVALALGDDQLTRGLPEITTPDAFAAALAPLRPAADDGHPYGADTAPIPVVDPRRRTSGRAWLPARRSARIGLAAGVAVLAVAIAGLFWTTGPKIYPHFDTHRVTDPTPSTTTGATAGPTGAIVPQRVTEFDPYGDHTDPHVGEAPAAADGNPSTAWHTQTFFNNAKLGNEKPGVGLLIDLGTARTVSAVQLTLLGAGTTVVLLESDGAKPPTTDKQMSIAATAADAGAQVTLRPTKPTTARYWVVWLTKLPAGGGGFRGGVAEVSFRS
ncbi:MAG: hypothetical protein ACRDV3_04710 [Acidothermaceae bacterium]